MLLSRVEQRDQFLSVIPVSRETQARLDRFEELIIEQNHTLSLISSSTLDQIWSRHFLDSAQLMTMFPNPEGSIIDLGTGAGFPGLVLAIIGAPQIHLIENNMRKVAFLKTVIAELALPVTIHAMKAESVRPFVAGVVTSRALKPLNQLIGLAHKFLGTDSVCVFPKGRRADDELASASQDWNMTITRYQSITDAESTIFRLSDVTEIFS